MDRKLTGRLVGGAALVAALGLVFLAVAPSDTVTQTVAQADAEGITVTGTGKAEGTPDLAAFDVGVEANAGDVGTARDQAADAAGKVVAALKQAGVADKDIQTRDLSVSPNYEYSPSGGQPRIIGYRVANTVRVKVRDMGRLAEAVDSAIAAGGDFARMQGIRFEISERTALEEQARKAAVEDARKKADQLAQAAGLKLGDAKVIQEVTATPDMRMYELALASYAPQTGAPMPIELGTTTVRIDVSVRWEFQ